jgi:hypothetical protein
MFSFTNSLVPQITIPGLSISVNKAVVFLSGSNSRATIPATTVPLKSNATNYVFLNYAVQAVQVNQTGFPLNTYPVAIVLTNNSGVIAMSDQRSEGLA